MSRLFQSRKFWIAVVDCVISLVGIWAGFLLVPEQAGLVVASFAALQLPVIALIGSIAVEDSAALKAGVHPNRG